MQQLTYRKTLQWYQEINTALQCEWQLQVVKGFQNQLYIFQQYFLCSTWGHQKHSLDHIRSTVRSQRYQVSTLRKHYLAAHVLLK